MSQTREALKYEGESTIQVSFSVLGQVDARELFANPLVAGGMTELGKQFDDEKLKRALKVNE